MTDFSFNTDCCVVLYIYEKLGCEQKLSDGHELKVMQTYRMQFQSIVTCLCRQPLLLFKHIIFYFITTKEKADPFQTSYGNF
jgi:hypothetical protein